MAFNIDIPEGAPNLYVYGIIEKKSRKLISDFFYTIKEAKDYLEYNEYGKGYRAEKFSKKIFFPVYRK